MRGLSLLLVLIAAPAAADPITTTCYAGTETGVSDGVARPYVEVRDYDRAKHEVRLHTWREAEPTHESVWTWHIADDGKSYTVEAGSVRGKGTLEGAPWKWTGYHTTLDLRGHAGITNGKIGDGELTESAYIDLDGKPVMKSDYVAKAFDCKDLAKRRAALDDTAGDAKHMCFAGEETSVTGRKRPVVQEQFFEATRIKLVLTTPHSEMRFTFDVDGKTIKVTNGERSWTGTGTIEGKPGAWTHYAFSTKVNEDTSLALDGTLGGKHLTLTGSATDAGRVMKTTTEADAFDCKELATRIQTLH